jgi:hypothetical protein
MISFNESNRTKHYKGYKVLIDNSLKDEKGKPIFGETDTKKRTIKINVKHNKQSKKRGELADTISHELLHAKTPRLSEKQVYKRTAKLPAKQKVKNLKYLPKHG